MWFTAINYFFILTHNFINLNFVDKLRVFVFELETLSDHATTTKKKILNKF